MTSPNKIKQSHLERNQDITDRVMLGAILVVVIGLIIETIPEFIPSTGIVVYAHKVGSAVVTIGVMAELAVEYWAMRLHSRLREINESINREAEKEISDLQLKLSSSLGRQESLERLVGWLRLDKSPRWARFDVWRFIGLLADKPTAKAEILYQAEDPEASQFANHIVEGLVAARWNVQRPNPIPPMTSGQYTTLLVMGGNATGVTLLVRTMTEDRNTPYGALFEAFLKLEVQISGRNDPSLPEGEVRILVAPKP